MPEWIDPDALDRWTPAYGYPGTLPANAATALLAASHEHRAALAPAASDETHGCLLALRSATILRDEHAAEAELSFKMLRVHLGDVPLDILEQACRAYCNAPGRRFFPRSAGELRTFTDPLVRRREARAVVLERLAKQAHEEQAERDRLAADPLTPEASAAIMAEFGIGRGDGPAAGATSRAVDAARRSAGAVPDRELAA